MSPGPWYAPRRLASKRTRLAPEVVARLVELYRDPTVPLRDLMALTGCGPDTVRRLALEHGATPRPQGRPRRVLTDQERADFCRWWAEGQGVARIAHQLRMSCAMAWRYVREWGLTRGETPAPRTAPRLTRRCPDCLAVFPLAHPACPNGHPAPEVA